MMTERKKEPEHFECKCCKYWRPEMLRKCQISLVWKLSVVEPIIQTLTSNQVYASRLQKTTASWPSVLWVINKDIYVVNWKKTAHKLVFFVET